VVSVPLGQTDWRRDYSRAPYLRLRNRFLEQNPANGVEGTSLLARPAMKRWLNVGDGPNRGLFSEAGSFDGALFVMSGRVLYRVSTTGASTLIGNSFFLDGDTKTRASMAATAALGSTPENLFIADGKLLKVYRNEAFARGELLASGGNIANNDVVEIGGTYYQWVNGSVDGGTPAGTSGNPWKVAHVSGDNRQNLENLLKAINDTGVAGTTYSTALTANTSAEATASTADTLFVQALAAGAAGNSITTTETGAHIAWGAATLTGGLDAGLSIVDMPAGLKPISVAFIAGYVIVVPAPEPGYIGRFYWIEPGEVTIDPLNFATAERSPDPLVSVRTVGDQFALFGVTTTEMWFPTGDSNAPFARSQSRVFDRGIWVGSDVSIKDTLVLMDTDGVVYRIDGGGPQRISDNSVEERTRKAIKTATSPAAPPTEGSPGPLTVTLSTGLTSLSEANTSGTFTPVSVTISGGTGPYTIRFFWGNQSQGTFSFLGASNQEFAVPSVSGVANSTTAVGTLYCSVTDADSTIVTSDGIGFQFTNTLDPGAPPPTPEALVVSVSPLFGAGSARRQPSFNFGNFTASVTGGTGPYTYQWYYETATDGTFTIAAPAAQITNLAVSGVAEYTTANATVRCRVTDSLGASGLSNSVGLTYTNNGLDSEVIP
jgi:hypothetical protein